MDGSERTPGGDILLGRHRNQLVNPVAQGRVVSDEREQNSAASQGYGQSLRMSQSASLGDCWFALCQCLGWKAETEEVDSQDRLRVYVGVGCGVMDKRAVGDRIIKRNPRFQMRSGRRELAGNHQVSTGGQVTQNKPGGIIALAAQTQQILVRAQRQIEFAA